MSVVTRLLSFGVTKGLAALLVLTLSVIGGVRSGFERTSSSLDEERPALVCGKNLTRPAASHQQHASQSRSFFHKYLWSDKLPFYHWSHDHLSAPSLLSGSAGGPRAPSAVLV
jgi:hypothetical protein